MKKERPIYRLRKILSYKNISKKNYEQAYELLSEIKDSKPQAYHNYLGKFLLNEGKIEEAKNNFLIELSINPQSVSAHYNLYKISVREDNYQSAYNSLCHYIENSNETNIELPFNMIKLYLDKNNNIDLEDKNYQVENSDKFVITKLEDEEALNIYNKVICDFNQKDFVNLKKDLNKLRKIVNEKNIKIEVDTLIKITEDILKKFNYEKHKPNGLVNVKELLRNIDILSDKNSTLALEKLELLKENKLSKKYILEIKYLENKINEKQLYNNLSDKRKDYYNICIENGRKAYLDENYQEALVCYETGKYVTKHPIFDYYIGKIYYKKHKIKEAKEKLLEYEKVGGEKLAKTYLYLCHVNNIIKAPEEKRKASLNLRKLNSIYDINFYKTKNYKQQKDIIINEDEFLKENNITEFEKEIDRIKKLYMKGNNKQADKLLTQLERNVTDKKNKEEIKTLSRNKTLYKNKNR